MVSIDDQPWFIGSGILVILFGKSQGNAWKYDCLDGSELSKVSSKEHGLGQGPARTLISESGLYKFIMRSDKPQAKAFQDWVTKEVLPAIFILVAS